MVTAPRAMAQSVPMTDCRFCAVVAGEAPGEVVARVDRAAAFLDVRPVFKGHVLVVPTGHVVTLPDLPVDQLPVFFGLVQRLAAAVVTAYGAQGSFVAANNTVSQSVPHLHVHVVPRTKGDGLRGFFWPRQRYGEGEMARYAEQLRAVVDRDG
jgi:histidine triad (HIT) family protein